MQQQMLHGHKYFSLGDVKEFHKVMLSEHSKITLFLAA